MTDKSNDKPRPRGKAPKDAAEVKKQFEKLKRHGGRSIDFDCLPEKLKSIVSRHMRQVADFDGDPTASPPQESTESSSQMPLTPTERLEIHSAEVQEILGYIPTWIVRWGITVIFVVVIVLLLGSWFVKYPDIVLANIEVTSTSPPIFLKARTSGKLIRFLVADRQTVTAGDYLVVLETTADFDQIPFLKTRLERLRERLGSPHSDLLKNLIFEQEHLLGELQVEYDSFIKSVTEYQQFFEYRHVGTKLASLRLQLAETRRRLEQLDGQANTLEADFALSSKQHERTKTLYEGGMISQEEFENSEAMLLQKEYNLTGARVGITNTNLQIAQLGQSIVDLQYDSLQTEHRLLTNLRQSCDVLMSRILSWEQTYVLVAPVDGEVSLARYWKENQNVSVGDNVLAILPTGPANIVGRLILPLGGSGKVRVGQRVNVKLAGYPHTEYGVVRGLVESKSQVPEEDGYIVTVSFPEALTTNYGIPLRFSQKMSGTAEIITDDLRLLERVFSQVRSYLNNAGR